MILSHLRGRTKSLKSTALRKGAGRERSSLANGTRQSTAMRTNGSDSFSIFENELADMALVSISRRGSHGPLCRRIVHLTSAPAGSITMKRACSISIRQTSNV